MLANSCNFILTKQTLFVSHSLGLEQSDQRQQTLVESRRVFSRELGLTQILVQQQTAGETTLSIKNPSAGAEAALSQFMWMKEEEEEESLPSHSLVQAFGQRNRFQDGLQHAELVCLTFTCDTEQQVNF